MTSLRVLPLLLLASSLAVDVALGNVYSCAGFVRSSIPVDYSKIKVKLLTPEGHLKHEEEINAVNGYYMIPVYSKGSYAIKVVAPEGWHFEPSSYDFKLDGVSDRCTREEDINFSLTAFDIDGVVETGQGGPGPSGLSLTLLQGEKVIAQTTTTNGGRYSFVAPPGKYTVSTSKDSSVCISHGKSMVDVTVGPVRVEPSLRISGYPVEISTSMKDVDVTLYAKGDPQLDSCRAATAADAKVSPGATKVCSLGKTAANGKIRVACMAPGAYDVQPSKSALFFQPSLGRLSVESSPAFVSFTVSGFTASGRVIVAGKGMADVDVVVNGQITTKTDASGAYKIENVKEGTIKVSASAKNTKFTEVTTKVHMDSLTIPDVAVQGFEVCGSVEKGSDGSIETIALVSAKGETASIRPESTGKFCTTVAPGKYTLSPANGGSSLSPRKIDVDASSSPSSNHAFTHFKTDATAKVTCIGACDSVVLSLVSRSGGVVATAPVVADTATFKDVSPGKYTVRAPTGGRWCWEESEAALVVDQSAPAPVYIIQSGFNGHVVLSHPAKIEWFRNEDPAAKGTVDGKKGINEICLPIAGSYKLQLSSCFAFDKPTLTVAVPTDMRIEANAISALVSGKIAGVSAATKVVVKSASGERDVTTSTTGVFSFQEPLSSNGQKIVVTPHSTTHLFEPTSASFVFSGQCSDAVAAFEAHKGIFLDGSVSPGVEGVQVKAVHKKDANLVFQTTTDKAGKYRVGPVRNTDDLSVSAVKDGYAFSKAAKHGDFASVKLSQLTLTFEDAATGERLNDAVLYLRGGASGEKSQHKVEKDGQIKLAALAPGTIIRAIMQEYEFTPSSITVTMKEGEHDTKVMKGKRVTYSAYGLVREMNGSPVRDVLVEALSEQCDQHQSEGTTAEDGSFRVRGLKPECKYRLALRGQEGRPAPPHCFPASFDIAMTAEDVRGLEMVAAPIDEGVELLVDIAVGGPANLQRPNLKVMVSRDSTGERIASQTIAAPVNIYVLRNLVRDGSVYTVTVEADRSSRVAFSTVSESFIADKAVKIVRLAIAPTKAATDVEISKGSIFALFFFALLAAFILNPQEWIDRAKVLAGKVQSSPQRSSSPSAYTNKKRK